MNESDLIARSGDLFQTSAPGRGNTTVATNGADPYASYGAKVGTTGQYLSFKNGEFLYGQTSEELPIGTHLIANMPGLRIGWRCWKNMEVVSDLTELLTDMRPIQRREELGDHDKSLWEMDDKDKPRDPWQLTNVLELTDQTGEVYIYSTSSRGGIGAIGRLCKEYGREYRMRPGMLPVIELGRDFYTHKTYGKTYFPEFTIVDWVDENEPFDDEAPVAPAPRLEVKKTKF